MKETLNLSIIKTLKKKVKGQVIFDNISREIYSCDASIFRIRPLAIVFPRDSQDVLKVVEIAGQHDLPLTARTAGTNLTGSSLGEGIILDFSRNMNRIGQLEENNGKFFVNVEPGVIYGHLNSFLKSKGFFLPPDPSSGEICMIGGNVALKASGIRSVKYGTMDDYLEAMEFVTAAGILIDTSRRQTIPREMREKVIILKRKIAADQNTRELFSTKAGIKTSSGYNIPAFLKYREPEKIISHLMVGSEGTLGIFTRLKLEVKKIIHGKATSLIYFQKLREAGEAVLHIKKLGPSAIELMNATSLKLVKERYPHLNIPMNEAHMLLVEFEGEERFKRTEELREIVEKRRYRLCQKIHSETEDEQRQAELWEARKSLVPILSNYHKDMKAVALVEDIGVGVSNLADIIDDLEKIFRKYHLLTGIYGHVGDGNLHLRPLFNLDKRESGGLIVNLMNEVYRTVLKYHGTITAEHGIGRLRSNYLNEEWGEKIYGYMREVKDTFDPSGILNPGVIFGKRKVIDDWKYPLNYLGKLDRSCIDCGYCKEICPLFRLEGGEEGGRALLNIVRYKNQGSTSPGDRKQINELLALCLGCKRCWVRCPSGVNIPLFLEKEKAKNPQNFSHIGPILRFITYHFKGFQQFAQMMAKVRPLYDNFIFRYLMGYLPFIYNGSLKWSRWDKNRYLPVLRRRGLEKKAQELIRPQKNPRIKVALFIGCASLLIDDGVVESTIRVLQKNCFQIVIPEQGCCGLPMSHYGYEKEARDNARKIIDSFTGSKIEAIVSTCGSCTERLRSYPNLFPGDDPYRKKAEYISGISYDISEFLVKYYEGVEFELPRKLDLRVAYHDSCHLVAAGVTQPPRKILKKITREFIEIDEGCCGGAGGYTLLHAEKSKNIFDLKLESIKNLRPDCIVSICPGCVFQFKEGLRRNNLVVESLNIVQLMDRYYQLNSVY